MPEHIYNTNRGLDYSEVINKVILMPEDEFNKIMDLFNYLSPEAFSGAMWVIRGLRKNPIETVQMKLTGAPEKIN